MRASMILSLALCLSACPGADTGTDSDAVPGTDASTGSGTDASTGSGTDASTGLVTDAGTDTGIDSDSGPAGTKVTFVTYVDAVCQTLPPMDSAVTLDTAVACNVTPDGSVSNVMCFADHITYTNHPNIPDCSNQGVEVNLPVGVCQQFPGPFETWKLIDPETYDCGA